MEKEIAEKLSVSLLEASGYLEGHLEHDSPDGQKPDSTKALSSTMVSKEVHWHKRYCLIMWVTHNLGALDANVELVLPPICLVRGDSKRYVQTLPGSATQGDHRGTPQ